MGTSVSFGLKTTVLISFIFFHPFSTVTIPGCPSRAALPISYQPTTKAASCKAGVEESAERMGTIKNAINNTTIVTPSRFIINLHLLYFPRKIILVFEFVKVRDEILPLYSITLLHSWKCVFKTECSTMFS
jgi:hypothetical protein